MGEHNDALVTDADLDSLGGGGTDDGGGAPDILKDKFGGDVNKLAESYVNLESKLGEQGTELGALRRNYEELSSKIEPTEEGPTEEQIVAALDKKVEDNEITQLQAVAALNKHRDQAIEKRMGKSEANNEVIVHKQIFADWAAGNEDLKETPVLEKVMVRIAEKKPHLVVRDKGRDALVSSLSDLLDLAKLELTKAQSRRGGNLDDGRSGRVNRNVRGKREKGNVDSATLERALTSDNEKDWANVVKGLL